MTNELNQIKLDAPEAALALHALRFYMSAKGRAVSGNTEHLEARLDQFLTQKGFTLGEVENVASLLGARGGLKGGASTSDAKRAAAAANGAKGGRPHKPNLFIRFHRSVWDEPDLKLLHELEELTGTTSWLPAPGDHNVPYVRIYVHEFTKKLEKLLKNSLNVWEWDDEKGLFVYCAEHKTSECSELRAGEKAKPPCLKCGRPSLWHY